MAALFDIRVCHRQGAEKCDDEVPEEKLADNEHVEIEQQKEDVDDEEEEDYYERVEPPDGQYFEAVNEIYAEIGGGYKRHLSPSSCSSSSSACCISDSGGSEEANVIVTAKPAIVLEDQLDSLSYVGYDDIGVRGGGGGLSRGGLYEDIAGSILNLARMKSGGGGGGGRGGGADIAEAAGGLSGDSPDEMLSYTLAKLSEASNNDSGDKSSDEWVDLDDDTDDYDSAERLVRNKGLVR